MFKRKEEDFRNLEQRIKDQEEFLRNLEQIRKEREALRRNFEQKEKEQEEILAQKRKKREEALRNIEHRRKERLQEKGFLDFEQIIKEQEVILELLQQLRGSANVVRLNELGDDPKTRKLYEKAIKDGVDTDKTIRVMIIGCYGQGKTTLVRRLKGESVSDIDSTDGIVISRCINGNKQNSPWTKDDDLTDDSVSEKLAMFALSASAKQSNSPSRSAGISDLNFEQQDTQSLSQEESPSDQTQYGRRHIRLQKPSENYKKFRKTFQQQSIIKQDSSNRKHISLWDFGGQYIYYATHQLFHSAKSVYLLVFNLSLSLDDEVHDEDFPGKSKCKTMKDYIIFWMHSIHSFVGSSDGKEPVVILVGTHMDKLQSDEKAERYFEDVRELFEFSQMRFHIYAKHFALRLNDDTHKEVDDLKAAILEVGDRQEFRRDIPARWILLECELNKHANKHIISFQELLDIDQKMEYPIKDVEQVKLFLKFNHSKGTFFYFDEVETAKYVVVNPQFVIDAFRTIIKAKRFCKQAAPELVPLWNDLTNKAILDPQLFRKVWKENESKQFIKHEEVLVMVLKRNRIIAEVMKYEDRKDHASLKPQGYYIVPLQRPDDGTIEFVLSGKHRSSVSIVYSFYFIGIVGTIFQRMLAAAIGTWPILSYEDSLMLFENGGVFELDLEHAGWLKQENENIELCVVNLIPENAVAAGIGDYFRRFVEVVIQYEFSRLKSHDLQIQFSSSYNVMVRCMHEDHLNVKSKNMVDLKKVQENSGKRFRCPDTKNHSINKRDVQKDWFQQASTGDEIPARKLTPKEYSTLSGAIGYDWRMLGVRLLGDEVKLQQIDMDNHRTVDKIYELLLEWDKRFEEKATLDVLVKELHELPANSVNWEKVYNLKDNFYQY